MTVQAIPLVLTTTNVSGPVQDSGNANPESNFRFDASLGGTGGYIFNLSTKGLVKGTYDLVFTVEGDATTHSVSFQVR